MAKRDNEGDGLYVYCRLYFQKQTIKKREPAREKDLYIYIYIWGKEEKMCLSHFGHHASRLMYVGGKMKIKM